MAHRAEAITMGKYVLNKKRIGMVLSALALLMLLPYILSGFATPLEQKPIDFDRLPVAADGFDEPTLYLLTDDNSRAADGDRDAGLTKSEPRGGERHDLPAAREEYRESRRPDRAPGVLEPHKDSGILELELQTDDLMQTKVVRIKLRPDLSGPDHIAHIRKLVDDGRGTFELYRAEAGFLVQGRMGSPHVPEMPEQRGPCPAGVDSDAVYKRRTCFPHDPDCGCHGPMVEQGMVAWAGGRGGPPDFFVYIGKAVPTHWSHDHTVWGTLADAASLALLNEVTGLPTRNEGMIMLEKKIHFKATRG